MQNNDRESKDNTSSVCKQFIVSDISIVKVSKEILSKFDLILLLPDDVFESMPMVNAIHKLYSHPA